MGLNSLKQLLLRKTQDEESVLRTFIEHMDEEKLIKYIVDSIESLEKGDDPHRNIGKNKNTSIHDWLTGMEHPQHEHDMFREALGHHVSHYKAALKAGNQKLADEHMRVAFNMIHMLRKAHSHTDPKTHEKHANAPTISAELPNAWEHTEFEGNDMDGFARKTSTNIKDGVERGGYAYLRRAPHKGRADWIKRFNDKQHHKDRKLDFSGAYPIEHIKYNDKHLPIEDIESPGEFVPHVVDSHPILKTHDMKNYTKEAANYFHDNREKLYDSEEFQDGMGKYLEMADENPDAYEAMGKDVPSPVHDPEWNKVEPYDAEALYKLVGQNRPETGKTKKAKELAAAASGEKPTKRVKKPTEKQIQAVKDIAGSEGLGGKEFVGEVLRAGGYEHHHVKEAGLDPKEYGYDEPTHQIVYKDSPTKKVKKPATSAPVSAPAATEDTAAPQKVDPAHQQISEIMNDNLMDNDFKRDMLQSSGHTYETVEAAGFKPGDIGMQPSKKEV